VTQNLSDHGHQHCRAHPRGSVRRASGFVLTGNSETIALKHENGRSHSSQKSPAVVFLSLCVQRQTAAIGVFLCFFRLSILAFELG